VRSSITFAGPCALINLILCRQSGGHGTFESVLTVVLESISTSGLAALCECLVHGHPADSTAIVHGKWPERTVMQRMVYSELLSSYIIVPKRLATLQLHSLIIPLVPVKWRFARYYTVRRARERINIGNYFQLSPAFARIHAGFFAGCSWKA
jgi:hypothetical protein